MDRKYYDINTGIIKYDAVNNSFIRQTPNGILQIGGPKGDKGDTGDVGPKGDTGIQGKSAYQVWIDAGNIGTETDFINSLRGEPGAVSFTDVPANYDFVVDTNIIAGQPMPNPWWRRFKSGYIEQGGIISTNNVNNATITVSLPVRMINTDYELFVYPISQYTAWPTWYSGMGGVNPRATNSFTFVKQYANKFSWRVSGMAES
jgi:hypothetical protein